MTGAPKRSIVLSIRLKCSAVSRSGSSRLASFAVAIKLLGSSMSCDTSRAGSDGLKFDP